MFEWLSDYSFEMAATAFILGAGAMFVEACWRAATNDLVASDNWIKSKLSQIRDEETQALVKELLIDHTGLQAKVITRSNFREIHRKARINVLAARQNTALADI